MIAFGSNRPRQVYIEPVIRRFAVLEFPSLRCGVIYTTRIAGLFVGGRSFSRTAFQLQNTDLTRSGIDSIPVIQIDSLGIRIQRVRV